jgi:hypothetical protein
MEENMANTNDRNSKAATSTSRANPSAANAPGKGSGAHGSTETQSLPKTWDDINVGSEVIAFESSEDGWWEAIVTEINGEMLTLRWRDYPRQPMAARAGQFALRLYHRLVPC